MKNRKQSSQMKKDRQHDSQMCCLSFFI
jgi:hypothetical protein